MVDKTPLIQLTNSLLGWTRKARRNLQSRKHLDEFERSAALTYLTEHKKFLLGKLETIHRSTFVSGVTYDDLAQSIAYQQSKMNGTAVFFEFRPCLLPQVKIHTTIRELSLAEDSCNPTFIPGDLLSIVQIDRANIRDYQGFAAVAVRDQRNESRYWLVGKVVPLGIYGVRLWFNDTTYTFFSRSQIAQVCQIIKLVRTWPPFEGTKAEKGGVDHE